MGGHPYWYVVPFEDPATALGRLREREFWAGRYNPIIPFLKFAEPEFSQQCPGPKHKTIAAAVRAAQEDGTRSILDIDRIAATPDYGAAAPLSAARLIELYGTDKPTREMVDDHAFFGDIARGQCVYVIVYDRGAPSELLFAGYSYD